MKLLLLSYFCSIVQSVENILENLVDQEDFKRLEIVTREIKVRADKVRKEKGEIEEGK